MNNEQWVKLKNEMFSVTPHSTKAYQKYFNNTLKKNREATNEARALFPTGDSLYFASNSALSAFAIAYEYGITDTKKTTGLARDIDKLIDKKRKR